MNPKLILLGVVLLAIAALVASAGLLQVAPTADSVKVYTNEPWTADVPVPVSTQAPLTASWSPTVNATYRGMSATLKCIRPPGDPSWCVDPDATYGIEFRGELYCDGAHVFTHQTGILLKTFWKAFTFSAGEGPTFPVLTKGTSCEVRYWIQGLVDHVPIAGLAMDKGKYSGATPIAGLIVWGVPVPQGSPPPGPPSSTTSSEVTESAEPTPPSRPGPDVLRMAGIAVVVLLVIGGVLVLLVGVFE